MFGSLRTSFLFKSLVRHSGGEMLTRSWVSGVAREKFQEDAPNFFLFSVYASELSFSIFNRKCSIILGIGDWETVASSGDIKILNPIDLYGKWMIVNLVTEKTSWNQTTAISKTSVIWNFWIFSKYFLTL